MSQNQINYVWAFILFVLLILGTIDPFPATAPQSYLDDSVTVTVDHKNIYQSDVVTINFEAEGEYLVTFVPFGSHDLVPESLRVSVHAEYLPHTEVVKQYLITSMKVIVTKDDISEEHDFIRSR